MQEFFVYFDKDNNRLGELPVTKVYFDEYGIALAVGDTVPLEPYTRIEEFAYLPFDGDVIGCEINYLLWVEDRAHRDIEDFFQERKLFWEEARQLNYELQ